MFLTDLLFDKFLKKITLLNDLPGSRSDGSVSLFEMSPSKEVFLPSNDFFLLGRGDSESERFGRFFGIKSGSGLKSELPSCRDRCVAILWV